MNIQNILQNSHKTCNTAEQPSKRVCQGTHNSVKFIIIYKHMDFIKINRKHCKKKKFRLRFFETMLFNPNLFKSEKKSVGSKNH